MSENYVILGREREHNKKKCERAKEFMNENKNNEKNFNSKQNFIAHSDDNCDIKNSSLITTLKK